jgi:hypothetical protein
MNDTNLSARMDRLVRQLTDSASVFFSEPFSFSWWLRGGEPGSPSDKLTLEGDHGSVVGTYIRARFDAEHEPQSYSEKFARVVDTHQASAILQRLLESPLFRERLKEESDRGMRDVQKETWIFTRGTDQFSKTLFEPLPDSLAGLRTLLRGLIRQLAETHEK